MADFKLNRLKFRWTGSWVAATDYIKDDVVQYAGRAYVARVSHTSGANFYTDHGLVPRDLVVTAARNGANTADIFYINGVQPTTLNLLKGRTYIFNQDDNSNVSFGSGPNPLHFSATSDGLFGGGANYTKNVSYWLDRVEVTASGYNAGFAAATYREVRLYIADDTPSTLYVWSKENAGYGFTISAPTETKWEMMFDGSTWYNTWQVNTHYNEGSIVRYSGKVYRCLQSHTSNLLAFYGLEADILKWEEIVDTESWQIAWIPAKRYFENDLVTYGGRIYRANQGHTASSSTLNADITKWDVVYDGTDYRQTWNTTTIYKLNDVVKYGPSLWKCNTEHTSTNFNSNLGYWDLYLDGMEFENIHDTSTLYQTGDVVWYGGYNYRALQTHTNRVPSTQPAYWQLVSERYKFDGDWDTNVQYEVGNVVRLNGYLYTAIADSIGQEPPNGSYWEIVNIGSKWQGLWAIGTYYKLGDLSTYGSTTYKCVLANLGSLLNRPDIDLAGSATYWEVYAEGHDSNVLAAQGDLLWYNSGANDRFAKGDENEVLKVSGTSTFTWGLMGEVAKVYYVAPNGVDDLSVGTTVNEPWRTVKFACENVTGPATIFIKTGVYSEELPISIPAGVALVGDELRSTVIQPAAGYESTDMFYVRNATGIRNMTLQGLFDSLSGLNTYLTRRPINDVKFVSLDPGTGPDDSSVWITNKSPYVQNVSTFGTGCIGIKVDGALHNGGNDSIVANDFTQIISGGIGAYVTNLGRAELVSVFTYYCHIGYLAEDGGKIRATNGNNSYGDYGSIAEGIDANEVPITATVDNRTLEAQIGYVFTNGDEILTVEYTNAGVHYDASTSYTFTGPGTGTSVSAANVYNNAIYEIRIVDPQDSGTVGGGGYLLIQNYAQAGSASSGTITLSGNDENEEENYLGMKVIILAGNGVGQYGYITAYDSVTKVASIAKESDDTPGWDHLVDGTALVDLDTTSRYQIEPRVIISASPGENATARVAIASGRIGSFRIINPGSGYTTTPTVTVIDPNATSEVTVSVRLGDGVLGQPTYSNRGTGYVTASATVDGIGYADIFQTGPYIYISNISLAPGPGANVEFAGDSIVYRLVTIDEITGSPGSQSARIRISPRMSVADSPNHSIAITIRENYSQVRLTGHDFLDIGTGNLVETNYPGTPANQPEGYRETNNAGGGRVFYTSTDQDGNFRVGELFKVEQATGIITLNADAFDLNGLEELRLGGVVLGGTGAVVREFSTDSTLGANSNNIVPTQRAIAAYIASQIGGGGEDLNVSQIRAGNIIINSNQITAAGDSFSFETVATFKGGIDGDMLASIYFNR